MFLLEATVYVMFVRRTDFLCDVVEVVFQLFGVVRCFVCVQNYNVALHGVSARSH